MNPVFLLDTNIFIYVRRRHPPEVLQRFALLSPGEAALSVISYGELLYGIEKGAQRDSDLRILRQLASSLPILPLPTQAGETYGILRAQLAAAGRMIGSNDLWIAAHATAANLILVTNNEREFRRVPGLRIENWTKPAPR